MGKRRWETCRQSSLGSADIAGITRLSQGLSCTQACAALRTLRRCCGET